MATQQEKPTREAFLEIIESPPVAALFEPAKVRAFVDRLPPEQQEEMQRDVVEVTEILRDGYRQHGSVFGDTCEGLFRWIGLCGHVARQSDAEGNPLPLESIQRGVTAWARKAGAR